MGGEGEKGKNENGEGDVNPSLSYMVQIFSAVSIITHWVSSSTEINLTILLFVVGMWGQ